MQGADGSVLDCDRFVCQLFPIPDGPRGNYRREAEGGQCGETSFVGLDAALGSVARKVFGIGEPRAERKFVGQQNIGTRGGDGVFQLVPRRASGQKSFRPFHERDAHRPHQILARASGSKYSLSGGPTP